MRAFFRVFFFGFWERLGVGFISSVGFTCSKFLGIGGVVFCGWLFFESSGLVVF